MKKFIYILTCLLWMSCANETKHKSESIEYDMEAISKEEEHMYMNLEALNYEILVRQKLIDYFDLMRLKQEHPEFAKDIILQLQGFSIDSESIDSFKKIDSITNVRQIGKLIKDSETIQKMTLYFDVVSDNTIKADSILAIISNKSILMDDEMVLTTKVYFQKIR